MSTVLGLMDLRGRTAIITGATGGIGRNMATVIAEMGGSLILVDRIGTNYDSLKKKIRYRSEYRGIKEMDLLLSNFVNAFSKSCSSVKNSPVLSLIYFHPPSIL